ncbi:MAG: response regulator [Oscillochloridaceae bacterium umkhey_bin13]
MQILLVDDNLLMQQVIGRFLESYGYRVCIATTGAEALALLDPAHCHLFVIDLRLPDQSGIALLATLRGLSGLATCPAIAISGLGEPERHATLAAGFESFLAKPIDLDELLATVQAHLGVVNVIAQ